MSEEDGFDRWLAERRRLAAQLKALRVDGKRTHGNGVDTTERDISRLRVGLANLEAIVTELRPRIR